MASTFDSQRWLRRPPVRYTPSPPRARARIVPASPSPAAEASASADRQAVLGVLFGEYAGKVETIVDRIGPDRVDAVTGLVLVALLAGLMPKISSF